MADEINNSAADDADGPTRAESRPAETASQAAAELVGKRRGSLRAFFWAAAFGVAALVPAIAWAQDLSLNSCTAGDVTVLGNGIVVNEPCSSSGTFSATVAFTVQNSASANRYCVTLYLVPDGTVLTMPTDVTLYGPDGTSTIPGKSTIT